MLTGQTGLLTFCASADNHMALLSINKVGGSRRGFIYLINQGVRIIEVLLYFRINSEHD